MNLSSDPSPRTTLAAHPDGVVPFRNSQTVLEVRDLAVHFFTDYGLLKAVDGINYSLNSGETLAIVGESGSGKSVGALALIGLVPSPGKIVSGRVLFNGADLAQTSEGDLRKIRGNRIAMIFQDPLTSLNPVMNIGNQIGEVIRGHQGASRSQARQRAIELLEQVEIPRARERIGDYPHQLSGGMRQRVMIAMAIALEPAVLIADEPTTALDVTVQAQILLLLKGLQKDSRMGLILITHDLGVVAEHAETVAVMYAGKIAEYAPVNELYAKPYHPYSIGLMNSIARLDRERTGPLKPIQGQPPSMIRVPSGCPFHPRCAHAREVCISDYPDLLPTLEDPQRLAACHFAGDLPPPRSRDQIER